MKWLAENGHIDPENARFGVERAGRASKELPAMEELSELMWRYAQSHRYEGIEETAEGCFVVRRVVGNRLYLEGLTGGRVDMALPADVAERCRVGWSINLSLGKTAAGWKILDVGNVYPY